MINKKFINNHLAMMTKSFVLSILLLTVTLGYCSRSNSMNEAEGLVDVPVLSAPVEGIWRVINSPGHQAFAYDLAAIDPNTGSTLSKPRLMHIFGQVKVEDFYSWGTPVKSPVSGTVTHVSDNSTDRESLNLVRDLSNMLTSRPDPSSDDIRPFAGNYIIINEGSFYVFLAHLRSGSIQVQPGDHVSTGQILGEVGNSGFTLEPHLHIQLVDQVDNLITATTLQFNLNSFDVMVDGVWNTSSVESLPKGKIVRFE